MWEATVELRWVHRDGRFILQQRWINRLQGPTADDEDRIADSEWRDVPAEKGDD